MHISFCYTSDAVASCVYKHRDNVDNLWIMQRRQVFEALLRCARPARLWDMYAFASGPSRFSNTSPKIRLVNEYMRLLGMESYHSSASTSEEGSFTYSNNWWRISDVNANYDMSPTYPFALLLPKSIRWDMLYQYIMLSSFHLILNDSTSKRFVCWCSETRRCSKLVNFVHGVDCL